MWLRLFLEYVPDKTPREREREKQRERESHVMWWWLLLGYVPDEFLSMLPM